MQIAIYNYLSGDVSPEFVQSPELVAQSPEFGQCPELNQSPGIVPNTQKSLLGLTQTKSITSMFETTRNNL